MQEATPGRAAFFHERDEGRPVARVRDAVPARTREQAASERAVARAISAREKASSFGVTSRRNQARSGFPRTRAHSRLSRWCEVFASPRCAFA